MLLGDSGQYPFHSFLIVREKSLVPRLSVTTDI